MTGNVMAFTDTTGLKTDSSKPLAAHAAALVRASARKSFDPFAAIDWSIPFDDSRFYLPPDCLPLYGTDAWARMNERDRKAYSRHETAALCGTGIWLENILMRMVVDHLYELSPTDPTLRYLLVEVGDECRHSAMFGEFVRLAGTPAYRPTARVRWLGRLVRTAFGGPAAFLAILAAEELLDSVNRRTMKDRSLHPVSREIARIHVIEEARHVSFARVYLERELPKLNPVRRRLLRWVAPLVVHVVAGAMVQPGIFETLGIRDGEAAARNNPLHKQRVIDDLASLVEFLEQVSVITDGTRPFWAELGLCAPRPAKARPVPGIIAPALPLMRESRP
jgi:hypothetical protein